MHNSPHYIKNGARLLILIIRYLFYHTLTRSLSSIIAPNIEIYLVSSGLGNFFRIGDIGCCGSGLNSMSIIGFNLVVEGHPQGFNTYDIPENIFIVMKCHIALTLMQLVAYLANTKLMQKKLEIV